MFLLVLIGIAAIVGFALYCMVCERIEAGRSLRVEHRAERADVVVLPVPAVVPPVSTVGP